VRAAYGDVAPSEPPLEVPAFLTHRRLAADALAHGDVESSLLHASITVRRFIATLADVDPDEISDPLASWLGDTVEARVVARLEEFFEGGRRSGLGHDIGAALLVARAMFVVIDRLIAVPPIQAIQRNVHASRRPRT
jgi:hypothetical protein